VVHSDAETTPTEASVTRLNGEEEGVDKADLAERTMGAEARERASHIPSGSTRSGKGKLTTVTAKAGDTLWKIAERKDVYGSGWLYALIYKANQSKIKDPNNLPAGLVLTVPRDVPDPEVEMAKEEAMTGQYLDRTPLPGTRPAGTVAPLAAVPAPAPAPRPKPGTGPARWIALGVLLMAVAGGAWWRLRRGDGADGAGGQQA